MGESPIEMAEPTRRNGGAAYLDGRDPHPGGKEAHRTRSIPFQMATTPIEMRNAALQLRGIAFPMGKPPSFPAKANIRVRASPC